MNSKTAILAFSILAGCSSKTHEFKGKAFDPPKTAAEIVAPDWNGTTFRLSEQRGKVVLLFFGYTSCPDICPTSFAKLAKLSSRLGEQARTVDVVFLTVDPERDTLSKLKSFVPAFEPSFHGVRLDGDDLISTKDAYGVYSQKKTRRGSPKEKYLVDHTSSFFAVDKARRLRLELPVDTPVEDILSDVEYLLREPILRIEKAMARATPGDAENGAAYVTIANPTSEDDRLLEATRPRVSRMMPRTRDTRS